MRLNIAVCEDNDNDMELIRQQLNQICSELGAIVKIDTFRTGEEFLASNEKSAYDIVFMDIFLEGISGIEAAKNSRSCCKYVFVTSSKDYAVEAFSLDAKHYIVKPTDKNTVADALCRCIAALSERSSKTLAVKVDKKIIRIPMESIVYIEVINKTCVVHTENRVYQTNSSLGTLYELLDEDIFMRVQQSFAVNMNYIESFFYDRVAVTGGVEISLSRNSRSELKKQYQRFLFDRVRGVKL